MTFIYHGSGALNEHTRHSIRSMMDNYPYMCEVRRVCGLGPSETTTWTHFHPWIEANIKEWPAWGEDCMGNTYIKTYRPVGTIHKNGFDGDTWFIAFRRERDRAAFLDRFRSFVVHEEPFRVLV
jgi:hypothetical protein